MTDKELFSDPICLMSLTENTLIQEADNKQKRLKVKTLLQRADVKNQNQRIYPKDVLEKVIKEYDEQFVPNMSFGQLDHPDSSVVEAQHASHTVDKIWWNGNEVWGVLEILPTPFGNIVRSILECGKILGVSSRGLGSVEEDLEEQTLVVQNDFELLCWDVVTNPSVKGSRLDKIEETVYKELKENSHYYDKVNYLVRDIICEMTGECSIKKKI